MATKKVATEGKQPDWLPLPKMQLRTLGCNGKDAVKQEKPVYMCRIFGEAQDVKTKEARSGDTYSYFVGEFRAINAGNEQFQSGILFLPGKLHETVEAAIKAAGGKGVKFAYDISSIPDEKSSVGYQYGAKSLIKTEASDRLEELTAELAGKK